MIVTVGFFYNYGLVEVLRHILKQFCSKQRDMDEYEKHRIKAQNYFYKFISLYLWLVLSHSVYEMAVENGFVTRATGTIEAAGFHTLSEYFQ
jgi:hypothetical protein